MTSHPPTSTFAGRTVRGVVLLLGLWVVLACVGCDTTPKQDKPITPPGFGGDVPRGVFASIYRFDLPLDASTDDAWAVVDEDAVPMLTRAAWRANGMRLGMMSRDRVDAYRLALPAQVGSNTTLINQSPHPVPIIETAQLPGDLFFEVDLTRPPMPRRVEDLVGGKQSRLRLLARIETEDDGRHTLVITPQHFIPEPYDLIPRDPLVKELDGRIFNELAVRLTIEPNQIAVVGLHWPWTLEPVTPGESSAPRRSDPTPITPTTPAPRVNPSDPAAPPPHLRETADGALRQDNAPDKPARGDADAEPAEPEVRRVAPPLATSMGSTLLTGTRFRKPVQYLLLITIQAPPPNEPPAEADP